MNINIIEEKYGFSSALSKRVKTEYIVLHHSVGCGTPQSIHTSHLKAGYAGIGYHFYIRKNGKIYRGRPIDVIGAHCLNYNGKSVGVCFEGNFEKEEMTEKQKTSGKELLNYLKKLYPNVYVKRHKDLNATLCPGKNFCFEEIVEGKTLKKELTSANDIIWELKNGALKIPISDVSGAVFALDEAQKAESPLYWILRKIVNK